MDKKPDPTKKPAKPTLTLSDEDKGKNAMLKTALRLGLRDIDAVQDYENGLDARLGDQRAERQRQIQERNARFEAERARQAKKDEERRRLLAEEEERSRRLTIVLPEVPVPIWKDDPTIPMTSAFLQDLTFAEMAKTPQGIQMSMQCLLHHEEVKSNAALREKMQKWLSKKMEAFVDGCYAPIVPLLLINHFMVRGHPVQFGSDGVPKTRLTPFTVFAFGFEKLFEAKPTKTRAKCLGMCKSKNPQEITVTSSKNGEFVMKLCLSHWNGALPEWVDIQIPENETFATIHSTTQVHIDLENNYDMFDTKGRVIGVASPEKREHSDLIHVTMYDWEGSAVTARLRRTSYEHGEYIMDCPMEMSPELKCILIGVMIYLLVEDLAGYEGRGEEGR